MSVETSAASPPSADAQQIRKNLRSRIVAPLGDGWSLSKPIRRQDPFFTTLLKAMKIGQGFDIHRLEEGLPFILGGVKIPFMKGAVGHSDGDALFHAVTDALFGALAKGDIGGHFLDTDPVNKNRDSAFFLKKAVAFVKESGLKIANVDSTIILQAPKLQEFIPAMRRKLSDLLEIDWSCVSIKAKTHEKLDALGKQEGVAVHAVVLLV